MRIQQSTFLIGLIFAAAMSRLAPHAPNFTAVGATALFAGAAFTNRNLAMLVPLVAMALTDLVLGLLVYGVDRAFMYALPVYACMCLTVWIGRRCGSTVRGMLSGGVLAALVFFFVSNLFVWARGGFYPLDGAGLLACYVAAVPFALNMLAANVLYGLLLVAVLRFAEERWIEPIEAA